MKNYFAGDKLSRDKLIKDRDFLDDIKIFLKGRTGKEFETDTKAFDAFVEHMRIGQISEVTAFRDMNYIKKGNQETKDRVGRLFLTFDRMKNPTKVSQMLLDYGEGILRSPSSYISLTGVGVIGKGSAFGAAKLYAETGRALATTNIKKETKRAALRGAGIEAGVGALQGAAHAEARLQTGRGEYDNKSWLGGALLGGTIGAIPGAVAGGAAGAKAFKQAQKAFDLARQGKKATRKALKEGRQYISENIYVTGAEGTAKLAIKTALGDKFKPILKKGTPEDRVKEGHALNKKLYADDLRRTFSPDVLYNMEAGIVAIDDGSS